MSRVYIAAGGALLIAAAVAAIWLTGRSGGQTAAERDALQSEIETRERVDDALDRPDNCSWAERLRGAC